MNENPTPQPNQVPSQPPGKFPDQLPGQPAAPTGPESNPTASPTPDKRFPKMVLLIGVALLFAVIAAAAILFAKDNSRHSSQVTTDNQSTIKKSAELKAVEQVFVSPVNGSKTTIKETEYYTVKTSKSEYYGRVSKINDDFIRMLPTVYKQAGALTFTGGELHGPEAGTYFKISGVTDFAPLTDTAIIDAIRAKSNSVSETNASHDINKYVKNGQFQAYFFADGSAFFAKTTDLKGTFLANSDHVYLLRTESVSPQVSLMVAKPEQYNKLTADNLLYWQNMKADSQIAKAASQYEKQAP